MSELLARLTQDHRQLLKLVEELETVCSMQSLKAGAVAPQPRAKELLAQLIELMKTHGQREFIELFPLLRSSLPKDDRWQIAMVEVQDEAFLAVAGHLYEWCQEHPGSLPVQRVREGIFRLGRWMREHISAEEERMFPRLEGQTRP